MEFGMQTGEILPPLRLRGYDGWIRSIQVEPETLVSAQRPSTSYAARSLPSSTPQNNVENTGPFHYAPARPGENEEEDEERECDVILSSVISCQLLAGSYAGYPLGSIVRIAFTP